MQYPAWRVAKVDGKGDRLARGLGRQPNRGEERNDGDG
jgi:hypothetical protein